MPSSETTWPPPTQAQEIFECLQANDPIAPSALVIAFLDPLVRWLQQYNPQVDPHVCATAAEDALLALIKSPNSYNPSRQSLEVYLRMSATGDLRNALRAEERHRKRRADLGIVELSSVDRKLLWERTDPALILERQDVEDAAEGALAPEPIPESVRTGLTFEEVRVMKLMAQGERKTSIFARVLEIEHLSIKTQRQEVKRTKDRLKRRLERARRKDG